MLFSLVAKLLTATICIHGLRIPQTAFQYKSNSTILILGGGVAGIMAARTLHDHGIKDFIIIEGRDELGGRLRSTSFAGKLIELGANWVQGTYSSKHPSRPANPIFKLVKKHKVKTHFSNYFTNITTYDQTGAVDYSDGIYTARADYKKLIRWAGARVSKNLVDATARTGYILTGAKPQDAHANVAEYFVFDWEYAQKPDQTSWIASSWANNFTFDGQYGFSPDSLLSIDSRGFKTFIQGEANEFIGPSQLRLSSVVKTISWSKTGVTVVLEDGTTFFGDYAICTFSLGVLQNKDVKFVPSLPQFKLEAIASMTMATFTKIFLHFPEKFWFDTEMGLYADPERGRYPVWQSLDHDSFLPGSGILFVTVTGDFSKRIEALPDEQVQEEVMSVLRSMYPNITLPDPLDFTFPRWHADPLYRGSYSNWPSSFITQHHDNLRANVDRLFFAGEATSQKYFGFLHGAYFEGVHVALEVVRCITVSQCTGLRHVDDVVNASPYDV